KTQRANALVSGETIELARQAGQHRLGQAVAGLRAVERENGDVADRLPQHRRLARGRGRFSASGGVSCHGLAYPKIVHLLLSAPDERRNRPRTRASARAVGG